MCSLSFSVVGGDWPDAPPVSLALSVSVGARILAIALTAQPHILDHRRVPCATRNCSSMRSTTAAHVFLICVSYFALRSDGRSQQSLTEDLMAFPKYKVSFLRGLPVHNQTAERWLQSGLRGGEREFLEQQWDESDAMLQSALKEIGGTIDSEAENSSSHLSRPTLQLMRLSPQQPYLCLIPPPLEDPIEDNAEEIAETTPLQSLSLLQPLSGSCLYLRQQWFTYSYCHNHQVRQFREAAHQHPHPPGGYTPQEDTQFEAFTLGQRPNVPTDGRELTTAQQSILSRSIEVANNGGQRYLVQRWGDGTPCDKDGRPREIEIQFHCALTSPDSIRFVQETKTCRYVMVINTPRLCGEPGFKAHLDHRKEAHIPCREILPLHSSNDDDGVESASIMQTTESDAFQESPRPVEKPPRDPILPPSLSFEGSSNQPDGGSTVEGGDTSAVNDPASMLRRVLESMLNGGGANGVGGQEDPLSGGHMRIVNEDGQEEDVWIEVLDADGLVKITEDGNVDQNDIQSMLAEALNSKLEGVLRAAGFDVVGKEKNDDEEEEGADEEEESKEALISHDEL